MSKIVKNTALTPTSISDVGVTVPASSIYTIQEQDYLLWAASTDASTLIDAGTIVINDGDEDLTAEEAKAYLKMEESVGQRFTTTTDLVSKNTRDAIEEVKELASEDNFSYHHVISGRTLTIKQYQQMIVHGIFTLDGQLNLDGQLILGD